MKKTVKSGLAILGVLAFISGMFWQVKPASADLLISPLRVVFRDRDRSSVVTLNNTSDKGHTYRIGWKMLKMNEMGAYENAPLDESATAVNKMIVYSPRQVFIEAGGQQSIRLSLRRPADLPPGEYRAHMTFTRMADEPSKEDIEAPKKGAHVMMNFNLGFSIPVIVRNGNEDVKISLSGSSIAAVVENDKRPAIQMVVNRDAGTFSAYGRIRIFHQEGGEEKEIGLLNNVALFPEMQKRNVRVPLATEALPSGKMRAVYEGMGEYSGTVWAEQNFSIGG